VSFCTSLPFWQANKKILEEKSFSRVEIQNDKNFYLSFSGEAVAPSPFMEREGVRL